MDSMLSLKAWTKPIQRYSRYVRLTFKTHQLSGWSRIIAVLLLFCLCLVFALALGMKFVIFSASKWLASDAVPIMKFTAAVLDLNMLPQGLKSLRALSRPGWHHIQSSGRPSWVSHPSILKKSHKARMFSDEVFSFWTFEYFASFVISSNVGFIFPTWQSTTILPITSCNSFWFSWASLRTIRCEVSCHRYLIWRSWLLQFFNPVDIILWKVFLVFLNKHWSLSKWMKNLSSLPKQ